MTKVTVFRQGGRLVGFEANGHTGYADAGEDIVCSAVSALTQTAVLGLVELLKLELALDTGEGRLYCMLEKDIAPSDMDKAEIILETMRLGICSIAETYGDYIKLIEREV